MSGCRDVGMSGCRMMETALRSSVLLSTRHPVIQIGVCATFIALCAPRAKLSLPPSGQPCRTGAHRWCAGSGPRVFRRGPARPRMHARPRRGPRGPPRALRRSQGMARHIGSPCHRPDPRHPLRRPQRGWAIRTGRERGCRARPSGGDISGRAIPRRVGRPDRIARRLTLDICLGKSVFFLAPFAR